jgi:hypothetical protein
MRDTSPAGANTLPTIHLPRNNSFPSVSALVGVPDRGEVGYENFKSRDRGSP